MTVPLTMTTLFTENYLHEIPTEIQFQIMKEVALKRKQELELKRKEELEEMLFDYTHLEDSQPEDIVALAVSSILSELKVRIKDDDNDDTYNELIHTLIDEQCQIEDWSDPKIDDIQCVVNWAGVMYLLKELKQESDIDILNHTSEELYAACYYKHLYNLLNDFDCNDIKIIQKFDINVKI